MPGQQSSRLWKETPSSVAGAFWLVSCAGQSCGAVPSAHNATVVSCSILSKYDPWSSRHLAGSVCTPGPSLALHLHPSLSTWLERDEITLRSLISLIFSTHLTVLTWGLESLPSKHRCKRKCDLPVAPAPQSKI